MFVRNHVFPWCTRRVGRPRADVRGTRARGRCGHHAQQTRTAGTRRKGVSGCGRS